MGLFDNIRMAADLVKGGIAAVKAVDKLVERSQTEYKSSVSPAQQQLYQAYKKLNETAEAEEDQDKSNELTEQAEAAEVAYLTALIEDSAFPREFRAEIVLAIQEYNKANGLPEELVEKYIMRQAKTDDEKEAVRMILDEYKKEEAAKNGETRPDRIPPRYAPHFFYCGDTNETSHRSGREVSFCWLRRQPVQIQLPAS